MPNLAKLPHRLDKAAQTCRIIVETPRGHRTKYDYDPESRTFLLKSLLPDGMSFPLDFGFIPSTLCEDGDPLDVMLLADEPSPVGAQVEVRLIGVIEAEEIEKGASERNDRVLAVAAVSHLYGEIRTPADLPPRFVDNLSDFWINKDRLDGKSFRVIAVKGPEAAVQVIEGATRAARKAA